MVFRFVIALSLLFALAAANPHLKSLANAISESFKINTLQEFSQASLEKLVSGKHLNKGVFDLLKNSSSNSQLSVEVGFAGRFDVRINLRRQNSVNVNVNVTNNHGGCAALLVAEKQSFEKEQEMREMVGQLCHHFINEKAEIIDAEADVLVGRFGRENLTATAGTKSAKGVVDGGFIAASKTKVVAK